MKSSVENVSNLQRRLHVEIPAAVVENTFQKHFTNIQKNVELKGFRKGKAPIATIRSVYGDRVKMDVVQDLIQNHYAQALMAHKLEPIGNPEFEFQDPMEGFDFKFSAAFDVRPEITLKKYEGLEVERAKTQFDESRVDAVLENLRAQRATMVDVLESRPAQQGDVAMIDFEGFVDGKPLEGGQGTDHALELGAKQFIEGVEDGVVGLTVGAQKTLNLKFPSPYHSQELAGKPVEFKVTLKSLKKKSLPELNDEFIKSIGGDQDLATLRETIRKDIQESDQKKADETFKNTLLKKLVAENAFDVPPRLMEEQKQALIEDFQKRMQGQGMTEEDYKQYIQKWDHDFAATAKEMIQTSFLIDAIARKHNLAATQEDVTKKFEEYAAQTGIELKRIEEFYGQPEQLSRLTYSLTEEKVIDFLTKSAKIKEV
ncbi:MAG: trigger factor [Bdellovibrionales bacterium]